MFEKQNDLPNLPIPSLEETLAKYLDWVSPILSDEQYKESVSLVDEFLKNNGPILQNKLIEWDRNISGSWLKPIWDESYLSFRKPIVPNMNYFSLMDTTKLKEKFSFEGLIGNILYQVTNLYNEIVDERMIIDQVGESPLCMEQYNNIFKATRVPFIGLDEFRVGAKDKRNNHVVVLYKNNAFKLRVSDSKGLPISPNALSNEIGELLNSHVEEGEGVGVFTTAPRDEAAAIYKLLEAESINRANLQIIADALVVLAIDDEVSDYDDVVRNIMLSDGSNRYFDKCSQIIITKNGYLGFNNEHTGSDGTASFSAMEKIYDRLLSESMAEASQEFCEVELEKLEWAIDYALSEDIKRLKENHINTSEKYLLKAFDIDGFGKNTIKKLKVSPDAFFHLALQIAFFNTLGKQNNTYEPVAVRNFKQGRTECTRPVNNALMDFIYEYKNQDRVANNLKKLALEYFKNHIERIKLCQMGLGVERHLTGLLAMYSKFGEELGLEKIPCLFESEGFKILKHDIISTSGLGYEFVKVFGFGPVVENGFGVGYGINKDRLSICLSSMDCRSREFDEVVKNLPKAVSELYEILL